ncbi:peptidase S28 [Phaeosphaeriaceae sp. SRC1lsM3a]|nr:peptidase S28 [Stagonospora sp. SRC1lsM3a]
MRASTCLQALVLAACQTTNALNNAYARSFNLLAEVGLNPDGTPIDTPSFHGPAFSDVDAASADFSIASVADGPAQPPAENITAEYVSLPIDHFDPTKKSGTFNNRYWVASRAYKPGGPVFIYDVGEANASSNALFRIQNSTSFFKQIVDQYNGIGIVWEHRFYGNSTPGGPVTVDTPAESFRYLNTEQSLADVAAFASQFSLKSRGINYTLTPEKTPWVFVGGSYPGMRAAFMRNMYPNTIYTSYASSAPVQASVDQSFYFEPVWRGMQQYGFGNCSRDIQAATRYIDGVFDQDGAAADQLKIMFLGKGAEKNSHATFADALTTIFATWQSYGMEGGNTGLRKFCDWLETGTNATSVELPNQKKIPKAVQRWASYPYFAENVNTYLETNCSGKADVVGDCDLNRKFTDPAMISWTWQYCTQWGYFQSANLGPRQLVSKYNSLEHQKDICHRQFPDAPRDIFPEWPAVDKTNRKFGGWNIRPSNTYWSNGEFDPWRTLSPASAEPFAPKVVVSQDLPKCGAKQQNLFGYVLPNAQHCYDFRTTGVTVPGGAVSRSYFTGALSSWLGCWKPSGQSGYPGKPWKA